MVDTALRLFAEQGNEPTTIAQITQVADVARKTFFHHFPTNRYGVIASAAGAGFSSRRPKGARASHMHRTANGMMAWRPGPSNTS
ncbi:helix-turn-helix domain-containing protein [Nonomuraea sp. B19D2]|uniref:TetR/AcrR family transcriptional regulator n=1 Tax=Nonomuraea sp. B19D2 TaxID=3159561 RepID=UPI0032DAAAE7